MRKDKQEDRLSKIDKQIERIKNNINIFNNKILKLKSNNINANSRGHLNADLARAKAFLELTIGDSSSEGSI